MDTESPDPNADELAACLDRLAGGDLQARDRIIELCAGRLRTLASRMLDRFPNVRRWDDTDDVFQNAAMRLHRALGQLQLDSPRAIMALAATQLHRELMDLARRYAGPMSYAANHATRLPRQTAPESRPDSDPPAGVEAVADADDSLERWTLFHEAIAALPLEQREVFHLVWYLGADQKTIARLLECSERTVKYRWRDAREAVRAALNGETPG
ncbi:MAG: sigma-70 family RNA polymerase sigma factor [Planctomycetota bacterium]|jgi:RNA polymerase sigma factor (sigma-70 family)|nr:sigma-70 family RNA polymerase sigma factor [Planctomycetota bacterium]